MVTENNSEKRNSIENYEAEFMTDGHERSQVQGRRQKKHLNDS